MILCYIGELRADVSPFARSITHIISLDDGMTTDGHSRLPIGRMTHQERVLALPPRGSTRLTGLPSPDDNPSAVLSQRMGLWAIVVSKRCSGPFEVRFDDQVGQESLPDEIFLHCSV